MNSSPLIVEAEALLSREPWREPARSQEIARRLRLEGHPALALRLEQAASRSLSWPGACAAL